LLLQQQHQLAQKQQQWDLLPTRSPLPLLPWPAWTQQGLLLKGRAAWQQVAYWISPRARLVLLVLLAQAACRQLWVLLQYSQMRNRRQGTQQSVAVRVKAEDSSSSSRL
jgi:hypothetical protein